MPHAHPQSHSPEDRTRSSYRNRYPTMRWHFAGLRLTKES